MTRNPANADQRISPIEIAVDPRVELLEHRLSCRGCARVPTGSSCVLLRRCRFPFPSLYPSPSGPQSRRHSSQIRDHTRRGGKNSLSMRKRRQELAGFGSFERRGNPRQPLAGRRRRDLFGRAERFCRDERFRRVTFFAAHQSLYAETEARLKARLVTADLGWLDEFFGEPSGSLRIVREWSQGRPVMALRC